MNTKVKKSLNPFLEINNKVNYKLPAKSKDYYSILIHKCIKRTYYEKYWSNLFNERPTWTELWIKRVNDQKIKKLGEFNFKSYTKFYQIKKIYLNGNYPTLRHADLDATLQKTTIICSFNVHILNHYTIKLKTSCQKKVLT